MKMNWHDLQTLPEQKQMFSTKGPVSPEKTAEHANLIDAKLSAKIENFLKVLSIWRAAAGLIHSLYGLLWKIYEDRYYYDYVGALQSEPQRQPYALTLGPRIMKKPALRACRAHCYDWQGDRKWTRFLASVQQFKDAVQPMTVHKSKVKFKYVFILNMDKAFNRMITS